MPKAFIDNLSGLWGSVEYRDKLRQTNSIMQTEKATGCCSDLLFDGDSTLYFYTPGMMEPDEARFSGFDSVACDFEGKAAITILTLTPQRLKVRLPSGKVADYVKVKRLQDIHEKEVSWAYTGASEQFRRDWLAGKYLFRLDSIEMPLTLLPDGRITPDSVFSQYFLYAYDEDEHDKADVIGFIRPNVPDSLYNGPMFAITKATSQDFQLDVIKPFEAEHEPIIRTGRKAVLLRRP